MYVGILYTQICIVIRTLPVSDSVSVIESATREIFFRSKNWNHPTDKRWGNYVLRLSVELTSLIEHEFSFLSHSFTR